MVTLHTSCQTIVGYFSTHGSIVNRVASLMIFLAPSCTSEVGGIHIHIHLYLSTIALISNKNKFLNEKIKVQSEYRTKLVISFFYGNCLRLFILHIIYFSYVKLDQNWKIFWEFNLQLMNANLCTYIRSVSISSHAGTMNMSFISHQKICKVTTEKFMKIYGPKWQD